MNKYIKNAIGGALAALAGAVLVFGMILFSAFHPILAFISFIVVGGAVIGVVNTDD